MIGSCLLRAAGIALAMAFLLASSSHAEGSEADAPNFARKGFYLGLVGVFQAYENFDPSTENLMTSFDDSAGVELRAGYRFHPRVTAEFAYQWLEGFDSTEPTAVSGCVPDCDVELDFHLVTINSKVFARTGRFQPYALVGLGALIVNTERVDIPPKPFETNVSFAARLGGGFDLFVTEHFSTGIEGTYIIPSGALKSEGYGALGLSLLYHF